MGFAGEKKGLAMHGGLARAKEEDHIKHFGGAVHQDHIARHPLGRGI